MTSSGESTRGLHSPAKAGLAGQRPNFPTETPKQAAGNVLPFNPLGQSDAPVSGSARSILKNLKKIPGNSATLDDLDEPLKPLSRPPPVYPTALLKDQPAGSATVEFFVDEEGRTQLPAIVLCSAPEFGYSVMQAVANWRFEVPKRGGNPVIVRTSISIEFAGRPSTVKQP